MLSLLRLAPLVALAKYILSYLSLNIIVNLHSHTFESRFKVVSWGWNFDYVIMFCNQAVPWQIDNNKQPPLWFPWTKPGEQWTNGQWVRTPRIVAASRWKLAQLINSLRHSLSNTPTGFPLNTLHPLRCQLVSRFKFLIRYLRRYFSSLAILKDYF